MACVGLGMMLGAHLSPLARSHIEQADVVFAAVSDGIVEQWLERMHPDVRSLQPYYGKGDKSRMTTYREWVAVMMAEVRTGRRVCAVFYGHPGIFAWSPHEVIRVARSEGYPAVMEPGISAEDCLYADLGIDPGRTGCQHYEASQLLLFEIPINPCACLVLWQVGVVGDRSLQRHSTGPEYRQLLADVLGCHYSAEHELIIYRAATLPIEAPRVRRIPLHALAAAAISPEETVVLLPTAPAPPNRAIRRRLRALEQADEDREN
ncbi:MAG TPA: SAM-dependent methyltransferase [Rhodanobacteraceae bacterium]|nr:SAM-dependent methyltransferase [Rhodanobacteraceae bacterium]